MTSSPDIGAEWTSFADLPEDARVSGMRARFQTIATQPDDSRVAAVKALLDAELALDDQRLATLTQGRYRAWIGMDADTVVAISECIADVRNQMTGPQAMRSITAGQTAATALSAEEIVTLAALAPSFRDALPNEMRDAMEAIAQRDRDESSPAGTAGADSRPDVSFWKFWAR